MPNRKDIVYNFITNLSPFQVQNVIDDVVLIKAGYKLYYAIDTYDLICHYLPFTKSDLFVDEKKNMQAQKAIAYSTFFKNNSKKNIIILDEYKYELLSIKYYVNKEIQNLYSIRNNLNSLKHELRHIEGNEKDSHVYLRNNFELILTLLLLSSLQNDSSNSLFSLLEDKLSLFSVDSEHPEIEEKLNLIFKETKLSGFTEKVYDKFVDEMSYFLLSIESDTKRYAYLENTYRDIEAIDRLNQINKKVLQTFASPKVLFIYLSSAPFKSKEIFTLISKEKIKGFSLPEIDSIGKYNFHRNILQTYILDILNQEFKDSLNDKIEILELLKKLSEQIKVLNIKEYEELELKGQDKTVYQKVNSLLSKYSSKIDNYFYYLSYEEYRNKYLSKSKDKRYKIDKDILRIIEKTEKFIEKEKTILEDFEYLSLNISQYRQTLNVSSLIDSSGNFNYSINIQFGKDIIKNNFHHLPYLIFFSDEYDSNLNTEVYSLLNKVTDITHENFTDTEKLTPHLKAIINLIGEQNEGLIFMSKEFIIVTYVSVLTLPKAVPERIPSSITSQIISEDEIIDLLKKQKKLISNTALRQKFVEEKSNSRLIVEKQNLYYVDEIDYMLLWLLRRNNYFDEAISLGEDMISSNENDPRLYHGLALACISKAYSLVFRQGNSFAKKSESVYLIDEALVYLYKSIELYYQKIEILRNKDMVSLVKKNLLAIYNSLADISIRKYVLLEFSNFALLEAAKKSLTALKQLASEENISFEQYPIFNNTLSELEYFEALSYYSNGDIKKAHFLILQATESASRFQNKVTPMSKEFNRIISDIDNLRIRIFKDMGFIK